MPQWPLQQRRAAVDHLDDIVRLFDEAALWLRSKNTDQWARPWPNRACRDSRILASLQEGKCWIGWDCGIAAATITADPEEDPYWSGGRPPESAVYIHRLIVGRAYAGAGLGAALIDWAGRTARQEYGSRWIRLSAWTTNDRLHAYYLRQGFSLCDFHADDGYPSAARFQKPAALARRSGSGLFIAPDRLGRCC